MSGPGNPAVQTLFRCGVCFEMFATSEECYSHLVTHEIAAGTQQDPATYTTEIEEADAAEIELQQPDEDDLLTRAVKSEITEAYQGESQPGTFEVDKTGAPEQSGVLDVLEAVGGSTVSPGSSVWVGNVGGVMQVQQQKDGRTTNEDYDIADILINIKQEKTDDIKELDGGKTSLEPNDLLQLANQVSSVNKVDVGVGTVSVGVGTDGGLKKSDAASKRVKIKGKKKNMKKNAKLKAEDQSSVPIVRRKKKTEEILNSDPSGDDNGDDIEAYGCKVCGKRYAILKSLKYHERTHDLKNLHYCEICKKGFVKPSELSNHKKSHMTMKDRKREGIDLFKCKYCEKEYRIEKSLKHHEKVHEVGKRYLCKRCNKTFFKPSDLQRHSKVHQPLAKCYICSKPFRDPKKLETHVRQHPEVLLQKDSFQVKSSNLMYCKYCNKKCATFSQLCNHVRIHTKKKPFPCDICGKMFNRVSNMRLHRKLHSGKKPFACERCGISFADFTNRNRHMKKYHSQGDNPGVFYKPRSSKVEVLDELPPAPKLKIQRETLINELRSAYEALDEAVEDNQEVDAFKSLTPVRGKNLLQCREVQGIPQQVQQLISVGTGGTQVISANTAVDSGEVSSSTSEQVYVVFEDNPSVCYVLEYEGDKSGEQTVPVKTMVEQMTMTDEVELLDEGGEEAQGINISLAELENADGNGNYEGTLEDEEELESLINNLSQKNERQLASSKRYSCTVCGLKFKHQGSLKFHYRKHTKEGVMYCEVCNAEFYRKSRLRVHMRDHTGERPYKCSTCEQTFKIHYDLTIHQRQHTGYGAIKCSHCSKIFYTRRALNAHLRNQSKVKPYSCSRCGKLFKRQDQRRRHMLTHVGNMPFHCHKCDRAFGDSSNRKRHIIKFHGKEALESLPKGRISLVKSMKNVIEMQPEQEN